MPEHCRSFVSYFTPYGCFALIRFATSHPLTLNANRNTQTALILYPKTSAPSLSSQSPPAIIPTTSLPAQPPPAVIPTTAHTQSTPTHQRAASDSSPIALIPSSTRNRTDLFFISPATVLLPQSSVPHPVLHTHPNLNRPAIIRSRPTARQPLILTLRTLIPSSPPPEILKLHGTPDSNTNKLPNQTQSFQYQPRHANS